MNEAYEAFCCVDDDDVSRARFVAHLENTQGLKIIDCLCACEADLLGEQNEEATKNCALHFICLCVCTAPPHRTPLEDALQLLEFFVRRVAEGTLLLHVTRATAELAIRRIGAKQFGLRANWRLLVEMCEALMQASGSVRYEVQPLRHAFCELFAFVAEVVSAEDCHELSDVLECENEVLDVSLRQENERMIDQAKLKETQKVKLQNPVKLPANWWNFVLQSVANERDPRNLLLVFDTLAAVGRSQPTWVRLNAAAFVDAFFVYFPVVFVPPPDDPHRVTAAQLKTRLHACFVASSHVGSLVVPLIAPKMENISTSAKSEAYAILRNGLSVWPADAVVACAMRLVKNVAADWTTNDASLHAAIETFVPLFVGVWRAHVPIEAVLQTAAESVAVFGCVAAVEWTAAADFVLNLTPNAASLPLFNALLREASAEKRQTAPFSEEFFALKKERLVSHAKQALSAVAPFDDVNSPMIALPNSSDLSAAAVAISLLQPHCASNDVCFFYAWLRAAIFHASSAEDRRLLRLLVVNDVLCAAPCDDALIEIFGADLAANDVDAGVFSRLVACRPAVATDLLRRYTQKGCCIDAVLLQDAMHALPHAVCTLLELMTQHETLDEATFLAIFGGLPVEAAQFAHFGAFRLLCVLKLPAAECAPWLISNLSADFRAKFPLISAFVAAAFTNKTALKDLKTDACVSGEEVECRVACGSIYEACGILAARHDASLIGACLSMHDAVEVVSLLHGSPVWRAVVRPENGFNVSPHFQREMDAACVRSLLLRLSNLEFAMAATTAAASLRSLHTLLQTISNVSDDDDEEEGKSLRCSVAHAAVKALIASCFGNEAKNDSSFQDQVLFEAAKLCAAPQLIVHVTAEDVCALAAALVPRFAEIRSVACRCAVLRLFDAAADFASSSAIRSQIVGAKGPVLRLVSVALDDRKRAVRERASVCANKWHLL